MHDARRRDSRGDRLPRNSADPGTDTPLGTTHQDGRPQQPGALAAALIWPKLKVDHQGDPHEREADDIADRVIQMPLWLNPPIAADERGGHGEVSRRHRMDEPPVLTSDAESRIRAGTPGGQPLPAHTREFFEGRFGQDFSTVKVHTGPDAAQLNDDLRAHAFTHANHIWLGAGQRPEPSRVLAHELAHVVQRATPSPSRLPPGPISSSSGHGDILQRDQRRGTAPAAGQRTVTATVSPKLEVTPGGLAPGKPRDKNTVFYGDTLAFSATVSSGGQDQVEAGVMGDVAGKDPKGNSLPPTVTWISPTRVSISVVVGQMGKPKMPGQPPELVEAKPYIKLNHEGWTRITYHSFRFKVVGDLQWLADRASIAGEEGEAAYLGVIGPLKAAFMPYKAAYMAHKHALENRSKRDKLMADILLNIFLVAVAGGAGGALQQAIKGDAKVLGMEAVGVAAKATAVGDVGKYMVRLGNWPSEPPKAPMADPARGGGTAGEGVGFEPDVWLAEREAAIAKEGAKLKAKCVDLKLALSEAWAQGKTELMDQDPLNILAPYIADLQQAGELPVKDQQEYARDLWRNWLEQYAWEVVHVSASGHVQISKRRSDDDKLMEDIKDQCGPGGEATITEAIGASRAAAYKRALQENIRRGRLYPEPGEY